MSGLFKRVRPVAGALLVLSTLGTGHVFAADAADTTLSPTVATMLEKAAARGSLQDVTLIAIESDPAKAPLIMAEVAKIAPDQEPAIRAAAAAAFPEITLVTAPPEPKKIPSVLSFEGWSGALELAGNRSTGNTDQTTAAVIAKAAYQHGVWTHKLNGLFDFERTDSLTTKRRWLAGYDINYDLSPRTYIFGSVQYENDRFAQIDYRFTEAAGIGYRIIMRDDLKFNVEAGPGGRQTRFLTGLREDELTAFMRSSFLWKMSDNSSISHDLVYIYGGDQQTVDTTAALRLRIIGSLSGQFSYNYRYNSNPPVGTRKVDTVSRVGLVYDF